MTELETPAELPPDTHQHWTYSHREILVVIAAVMTGMFLGALDMSIVGTALPRILSDLNGLSHLSWVVTAYLLTSTAVTPLWGKFSDMHGRRLVFQCAIGVFLLGSVGCGLAHTMMQLILARGVQGLGGGGLMAIALAIIGDVIPPRDRGRYQGYFGAVFGTSSVIGPLLGGWLTDGPGWRWIFWINVPIGIAAMVVIGLVLRMPSVRRAHRIDYEGAAAIVGAVSALLLYLNWAGEHYGWGSPRALWLLGLAVVLAVAFVFIEFHAKEPIIPMNLFRNGIFSVGGLYSFFIGMAMFGAIIFLPLYLQVVKGMTPTRSGLALIPMVVGIAGTSIVSGKLVSKYGRYKIFPVVGGVLLIIAQFLLHRVHATTAYPELAAYAFLLGISFGCSMQTVMVAVQNAVPRQHMGTATSATMFFRQTGSAIGTAVFGVILTSRLAHHMTDSLGADVAGKVNTDDIRAISNLAEPMRSLVLDAWVHAMDEVFLSGIPIAILALITALALKEIPLQTATPIPEKKSHTRVAKDEPGLVESGA